MRYEAEALQTAHGFCPAHVPEVFLYDPSMSVIAMQFLEPPHMILQGGIVAGATYRASRTPASTWRRRSWSSALAVGCERLREQRQAFGQNEAMCALTEQVIFTEPYCDAENNKGTSPQLDAAAAFSLRGDVALKTKWRR